MPDRLTRSFFARPVLEVAPELLGCTVAHAGVTIRLTEVEAYDGANDPGSHAFRGETARTRVMFGEPGGLYVYFTYGMHWCANLVCGSAGVASAVLLRAGEVVGGLETARSRRVGFSDRDLARGPARLAMTLALTREQNGIDAVAADSPLVLRAVGPVSASRSELNAGPMLAAAQGPVRGPASGPVRASAQAPVMGPAGGPELASAQARVLRPLRHAGVRSGPRVGISGPGGDGTKYPWRFWLDGEATVSAYRPGTVRPAKPAASRSDL